jgi:hypothetical protein
MVRFTISYKLKLLNNWRFNTKISLNFLINEVFQLGWTTSTVCSIC